MPDDPALAWHFTGAALRDGRPARTTVTGPDGKSRVVEISASVPSRLNRLRLVRVRPGDAAILGQHVDQPFVDTRRPLAVARLARRHGPPGGDVAPSHRVVPQLLQPLVDVHAREVSVC